MTRSNSKPKTPIKSKYHTKNTLTRLRERKSDRCLPISFYTDDTQAECFTPLDMKFNSTDLSFHSQVHLMPFAE